MAFQILLVPPESPEPPDVPREFRELILARVDPNMVTIARELYCVAYSPTYKRRNEAGLPAAVTIWLRNLIAGGFKSRVSEECWQEFARLPQYQMADFLKQLEIKCWPHIHGRKA